MINKIKLLYLVEDFNIGGLERVVETLCNGLDSDKYDIHLWCIASGGVLAEKLLKEGRSLRILEIRTYYNPFNIVRLSGMIKRERFDIVHAHGYFAGVMGRISAYMAGTPVIISHVHTTYWKFKLRNLLIDRLLSRITDRIICCSYAVRNFVSDFEKIRPDKVTVIYNGSSCEAMNYQELADIDRDPSRFHVVIIASLVENKGHRYLFEAISYLIKEKSDVFIKVFVVGDGPLKASLIEYAENLGIAVHTDFKGLLSDVTPIIHDSDVLVLPSIEREALGMTLLEGMCRAKPVIGTNIGGIPEIINDEVNGYLVKPMDSLALSEKLSILIEDPEKRMKMGMEGRRIFKEKFDAGIMIRKIDELYESLIRQKRDG